MAKVDSDNYKMPSDDELASATKVKRMIMTDIDANNNKYWNGYVLGNGDFYCEYGRVASGKADCRHNYYPYGDTYDAENWLEKKAKEKLRKGYTEQQVTEHQVKSASSSVKSVSNGNLKSIATQQIAGDAETKKLVKWLAEVNIHQITSHSNIQYNSTSGLFTTPLGTLITTGAIAQARTILDDMADFVVNRDWENRSYKKYLADYLMLVPQDVGRNRGWHETFLAGSNALIQQSSLLDSLEASLQQAATQPVTDDAKDSPKVEQVFNVSLTGLESGSKEFKRVYNKYDKEKGTHYDVKDFKVKSVWQVEISTVHLAFQKDGAKLPNVWELWHGTSAANLLSILKGGLVIPPSSSSHVTGRMYSDGVYFSDQSTKALRYATGGWGGRTSPRIFMFLCNVAMGNINYPDRPCSYPPPKGYNSYFAKAGKSGVMNNEMIIPKTSQCDILNLVEFEKK